MAGAYVLIDVKGDQVKNVLASLRETPGVQQAHVVAGPYDIIAYLVADNMRALGETVVARIRPIGGIVETLTCFAVDLDE
jgi:DNA-binding Lrp family transcriptional regulator